MPMTDRCPRESYVATRAGPTLDTRPPRLAGRLIFTAGRMKECASDASDASQ